MDKPAVAAVEDFVHAGYPLDAEALLIVELDGTAAEVDELMGRVQAIAQGKGATSLRVSQSEQERLKFWAGRKAAFPAVGRISPDYLLHGRHHSAQQAAAGADAHGGDVAALRPQGRQRVPCRRRQSASADPLRRQQAGRTGYRRAVRRGDPETVRRGRRRADRRAWRRRRKARSDAGDVQRGRPRAADAPQMRVRSSISCSIPARCSRPCIAARSWARCMCSGGELPFPDLPRF